jgi:hypothetical protein
MFKRGADGIAKKGKTEGKNLGNDGPTKGTMHGGKKSSGVSSEKMKAVGRGLAKVANQGG